VSDLLRLLFLVPIAYIAALTAATLAMSVGLMGGRVDGEAFPVAAGLAIGLTLYAGVISFVPALIAIVFAEIFRWRSIFFYLIVGGAIGLLSAEATIAFDGLTFAEDLRLLSLASGFVAGAVYWLIAGKLAGLGTEAAGPTSPA